MVYAHLPRDYALPINYLYTLDPLHVSQLFIARRSSSSTIDAASAFTLSTYSRASDIGRNAYIHISSESY